MSMHMEVRGRTAQCLKALLSPSLSGLLYPLANCIPCQILSINRAASVRELLGRKYVFSGWRAVARVFQGRTGAGKVNKLENTKIRCLRDGCLNCLFRIAKRTKHALGGRTQTPYESSGRSELGEQMVASSHASLPMPDVFRCSSGRPYATGRPRVVNAPDVGWVV